MITLNKTVLIIQNADTLKDINYEAIEVITDTSRIEEIWRLNKTPAILKDNAGMVFKCYPYLMLPDFIFGPDHFISFCHANGIECGEYCSKEKHNTAEDRCFLCELANHRDQNGNALESLFLFNQLTPAIHDIIMYESENFFVKIEYGCLKKGMVMINPKAHILSAAQIPDAHYPEYLQVMRDIEFLLKAIYGDETVIFFEHGSDPSGFSTHKRSIVHAHTHVAWGVKFDQKYKDMVCLKEANLKDLRGSKYFSYQEGTDGKFYAVSDPNVYVQRQYPRQIIGLMLGIPNDLTNWRKEAFMDNIVATFDDFYAYLKANQDFLCKRIVKATEGFVHGYQMRKC